MAGKKKSIGSFLKCSGVFILCGWMFFLGILVGRGTSPVSFNTQNFQQKLAAIADVMGKEKKLEKNPGLDFYEMLKKPVSKKGTKLTGTDGIIVSAGSEIKVKKSNDISSEKIKKMKKSRKALSLIQYGNKSMQESKLKPVSTGISKLSYKDNFQIQKNIKKTDLKNLSEKNINKGIDLNTAVSGEAVVYTIQIAAYKNLKDALKLVESLKKKGYTAYRTMGKKGNKVWHRVRIGSFMDRKKAKQFEKQLESNKFKGIIVRKDQK